MAAACWLGLVLFVGAVEFLRQVVRVSERLTRLSVHLSAGALAALVPWLFDRAFWPSVVAGSAMLLVSIARWRGLLPSIHAARPHSYGTILFPASAFFLYILAWGTPILITAPLLVMTFADAAGVLVGEGLQSPRGLPEGLNGKTWDGSVAVFGLTGLAVSLCWEAFGFGPTYEALLVGLACAPVAAAVEALSRGGLDNLTLPLAVAFTLMIPLGGPPGPPVSLLAAEALAMVVALAAVRWRALRPDGAFAAFVLATWLLGGGGWAWTLPVVAFFLFSSALSRLSIGRRAAALRRVEKDSRRDLGQVLANGGVPFALFAVWMAGASTDLLWPAFLGAVATATADTWATEIGTSFRAQARLITTGRLVPAGTSGGVTLAGTMGAVAGAAVIGVTAALVPASVTGPAPVIAAVAVAGGVAGAMVDSLLGATAQAHWPGEEGRMTEIRPASGHDRGPPARGFGWVDNDMVNGMAAVAGAALAGVLALLL